MTRSKPEGLIEGKKVLRKGHRFLGQSHKKNPRLFYARKNCSVGMKKWLCSRNHFQRRLDASLAQASCRIHGILRGLKASNAPIRAGPTQLVRVDCAFWGKRAIYVSTRNLLDFSWVQSKDCALLVSFRKKLSEC